MLTTFLDSRFTLTVYESNFARSVQTAVPPLDHIQYAIGRPRLTITCPV